MVLSATACSCWNVVALLRPRSGKGRAQVMCDVMTDAGKRLDQLFHLIEHAIDDHCKFGEGVVCVPERESFTQIAGDDPLYPLVDLDDAPSGARAPPHS